MNSKYLTKAPLKKAARSGAVTPPPMSVASGFPPNSRSWLWTAWIGPASNAPIATPTVSRIRILSSATASLESRKNALMSRITRVSQLQSQGFSLKGSPSFVQ